MKKEKECHSNFHISEGCNECSDSFDCFYETMSKEICFLKAKENFSCNSYTCAKDTPLGRICSFMLMVSETRTKICVHFGRTDPESVGCYGCKNLTDCEVAEIVLSDLSQSPSDARRSLMDSLDEYRLNDICFGNFQFEESTCLECGFHIRCRIESKLIPGSLCVPFGDLEKIFDKGNLKEIKKFQPCRKCSFLKHCSDLVEISKGTRDREEELKKVYSTPLPIKDIRKILKGDIYENKELSSGSH